MPVGDYDELDRYRSSESMRIAIRRFHLIYAVLLNEPLGSWELDELSDEDAEDLVAKIYEVRGKERTG